MDRKLFLQSLNQQNQDYSKIRKDRRNTQNEFHWMFEEVNSNSKKLLNEREGLLGYLQDTGEAIGTSLFGDESAAEKAAREEKQRQEIANRRKELEAKAIQQTGAPIKQEAPTPSKPATVTTQQVSTVPPVQTDHEGREIRSSSGRITGRDSDKDALKAQFDNFNAMVERGEITRAQAVDYQDQLLKRAQGAAIERGRKEREKAIESGLDAVATAGGAVNPLVALGHAGSKAIRGYMSDDEDEANEYYKDAAFTALAGAAAPLAIAGAAKGVAVAAPTVAAKIAQGVNAAKSGVAAGVGNVVSNVAGQAAGKATTTAIGKGLAAGINPLGAAAGAVTGMEVAKANDMGFVAGTATVLGSALAGGAAASIGNQIPGLGKVVADPKGKLLPGVLGQVLKLPGYEGRPSAAKATTPTETSIPGGRKFSEGEVASWKAAVEKVKSGTAPKPVETAPAVTPGTNKVGPEFKQHAEYPGGSMLEVPAPKQQVIVDPFGETVPAPKFPAKIGQGSQDPVHYGGVDLPYDSAQGLSKLGPKAGTRLGFGPNGEQIIATGKPATVFQDPMVPGEPIKFPETGSANTVQIKPATKKQLVKAAAASLGAPVGPVTLPDVPAIVAQAEVPSGPGFKFAVNDPAAPVTAPKTAPVTAPKTAPVTAPTEARPAVKVTEKAKAEDKVPSKAEDKAPSKTEDKAPSKAEHKVPAKAPVYSPYTTPYYIKNTVNDNVTISNETPPTPPPPKPPKPPKPPTPPTLPPIDPLPNLKGAEEEKDFSKKELDDLMGKKLGEFESKRGEYTKSVHKGRGEGQHAGSDDEEKFAYSQFYRMPTSHALNFRRQGLVEEIELKRKIKGAVSRYLKSKEGQELNKQLNSFKKTVD